MSTVYLARDETLERWVAVKVMHREISDQPDQLERFRREARAVAQLSHPNVVAVIDAGEDGGYPYIVFEYVEGETLKQRIDRLGRLPLDEAAAYAIEIGRGLAAAHARRLVHRDVKPQNVLIDAEGRAKVTDFGIARSLESDGLTKTGRVLGTTDYVSPEQAMGQGVDARSDIYSLGVLLYEMLTGEVPFQAETLVGVAMKHVNEQMPDVQERRPEISSALAAVIERATAKEPEEALPGHERDARATSRARWRSRSRARAARTARRPRARRGATRRRLLTAAAGLGRRDPAGARGDGGGAADRGADAAATSRASRRRRRASGRAGSTLSRPRPSIPRAATARSTPDEVRPRDRRQSRHRPGRPRPTTGARSPGRGRQARRRADRRRGQARDRHGRSTIRSRRRAAGACEVYGAAHGTAARPLAGLGQPDRRGSTTSSTDADGPAHRDRARRATT